LLTALDWANASDVLLASSAQRLPLNNRFDFICMSFFKYKLRAGEGWGSADRMLIRMQNHQNKTNKTKLS